MTLPLLFEEQGAVALITLNRPERHNAMSPELICRLADAFDTFEADDNLRVAVITGAGEDSFCSGGDLELTLPLLSGAREPQTKWDKLLPERLFRSSLKGPPLNKPVIAAINGHCLAGGFELMLAADIRFSAQNARFGLPEARHALIPFAGALTRLPRQIPTAVAMELALTGDQISAKRLYDLGLINHLLPKGEVLDAALEMAERIAKNGPLAVREIKRSMTQVIGRPIEEGFEIETQSMKKVMSSDDAKEGPRAFMERRKPNFSGS